MNLLRHRVPGRHRADSLTSTQPRGLASLPARHARRPRPQILSTFTGWASTARLCADAAKHPVIDLQIARPAQPRFDLDATQPFYLEIPPMSSPRVPDNLDLMLLFADAMGGGDTGAAIERQERQAQVELLNSTTIPSKMNGGSEEDLTALRFKLGAKVENDPLFRHAELPEGWSREGSDHAMWSYIVDQHGRRRCSLFFKGAFYDRDAFISVRAVAGYVSDCLDEDKTPILDEEWATRTAILEAVDKHIEQDRGYASMYENSDDDYSVKRLGELRERVAKAEALRATLTDGAE